MRLDEVLDELWVCLETVAGLNVADDGPGVHARPPAPATELPAVTYGAYGAGLDKVTLGLLVAFGQPNNAQTFRDALEFASTSGPRSIPAALLAYEWTTCHTVRCDNAEPVLDTINGHPMVAYQFIITITGAAA